MTIEHFHRLAKKRWMGEGACVPAALDSVSKYYDVSVPMYKKSIKLYESGEEGPQVSAHYGDLYRAVGTPESSVELVQNYEVDAIWELLIRDMRVIGNFVGLESHVVGIVRSVSGGEEMVDVVGLVFSDQNDGIIMNWPLSDLCDHVKGHDYPWVVSLPRE